MGSGKTTIGRIVATRLNSPFVDLDQVVESRHGARIAELWQTHGEATFRDWEREACLEASQAKTPTVIACGGGTLADPRSLAHAAQSGIVVFLNVPYATCISRCAGNPDRPLLDDPELRARFQRRLPYYRQADIHIDGEPGTPEEVAGELLAQLGLSASQATP